MIERFGQNCERQKMISRCRAKLIPTRPIISSQSTTGETCSSNTNILAPLSIGSAYLAHYFPLSCPVLRPMLTWKGLLLLQLLGEGRLWLIIHRVIKMFPEWRFTKMIILFFTLFCSLHVRRQPSSDLFTNIWTVRAVSFHLLFWFTP